MRVNVPEMARANPLALAATACVALAVVSLAIPSEPTYDPMAWLVWGREITQGTLVTDTGPSWKPLPILFTTPFALAGGAAPALWLVVARAAYFGAVGVAFLLGRRLAGTLAGVIAAAALAVAPWLLASALRGYSEALTVLFVLAAVERAQASRHGQAFALGLGAALLRPEACIFLSLYSLWLLWRDPRRLAWIVPSGAAAVAAWTLPEKWGSGSYWRAAERAQDVGPDSPALADHPALEVVKLAVHLVTVPGTLAAAVAVGFMAFGGLDGARRRLALILAGLAVAWIVLVAVMTQAGFSGNERYLIVPASISLVLAGAGVAWSIRRVLPARLPLARPLRLAAVVAVATVSALYVGRSLPDTMRVYAFEVAVNREAARAIAKAGGKAAVASCPRVSTNLYLQQRLAWELDRPAATVARWPIREGVLMRTRLTAADPVLPTRMNAPIVARTHHWEVQMSCQPAVTTRNGSRDSG
jgi:hypothetical protein